MRLNKATIDDKYRFWNWTWIFWLFFFIWALFLRSGKKSRIDNDCVTLDLYFPLPPIYNYKKSPFIILALTYRKNLMAIYILERRNKYCTANIDIYIYIFTRVQIKDYKVDANVPEIWNALQKDELDYKRIIIIRSNLQSRESLITPLKLIKLRYGRKDMHRLNGFTHRYLGTILPFVLLGGI